MTHVKQNHWDLSLIEYVLNDDSSQSSRSGSIKDALDIQNAAFMVPRAMTTIVQEGIEPMLIGTHLLQRIQYKSGMNAEEAGTASSADLQQQHG